MTLYSHTLKKVPELSAVGPDKPRVQRAAPLYGASHKHQHDNLAATQTLAQIGDSMYACILSDGGASEKDASTTYCEPVLFSGAKALLCRFRL